MSDRSEIKCQVYGLAADLLTWARIHEGDDYLELDDSYGESLDGPYEAVMMELYRRAGRA